MMDNSPNPSDDSKRIIVLIYGVIENAAPFWVFAAVRPSKYQLFMAAHKEGKLDVYQFEEYGEIVVCGEGRVPPDEVTLKVAEMYQTDPNQLKQIVEEDAPAE